MWAISFDIQLPDIHWLGWGRSIFCLCEKEKSTVLHEFVLEQKLALKCNKT